MRCSYAVLLEPPRSACACNTTRSTHIGTAAAKAYLPFEEIADLIRLCWHTQYRSGLVARTLRDGSPHCHQVVISIDEVDVEMARVARAGGCFCILSTDTDFVALEAGFAHYLSLAGCANKT